MFPRLCPQGLSRGHGRSVLGRGISPTGAGSYAGLLNIPGSKPDFLALLASDPVLQPFKAGLGSEQLADRSQLAAARQRALAQLGVVPDVSDSLGLVGGVVSRRQPIAGVGVGVGVGESACSRIAREAGPKRDTIAALSAAGRTT
jgi:hypothetical protein